jgi:hypothetical protein
MKRDSIIGNKYNRLQVVEQLDKNKHGKYRVRCVCDCGKECTVLEAGLKNGHTKSCGCLKSEVTSERFRVDYTGIKRGRLLMLRDVGTKKGTRQWECQCDCGKIHTTNGSSVFYGHTLSCGCLHTDNTKAANTTHGMSSSSEYWTYNTMLARCYNENSEKYRIYGARGITVSDEWLASFSNFYADMGPRPEGLTLERKEVNGNYCKENCMWDTPAEQAYNQRGNSNNTSGQVGVDLCSRGWRSRIWKNRVCYVLGYFDNFEDAVAARLAGEVEVYGYLKEKGSNENRI